MQANSTKTMPESVRMLRKQLLQLASNRPLKPFRIHLFDGRIFDVLYPNMLLVLNTFVSVGIPELNEPDPYVEHSVDVELTAIRAIELLPSPAQTAN